MNWRGEWDATVTYPIGDSVDYQGRAYTSLTSTLNDIPSTATSDWTPLTSYLVVDDLRTPGERYQKLSVSNNEAGDDVLGQMIVDASELLDRLTGDHFLPTSGTIIVDGPTVDGFNRRGRLLMLPRRVRSVTSVSSVASDGTTLEAYDADAYRVHSSLTDPATTDTPTYFGAKGYDGVEFLSPRSSDSVTFPSGYYFGGAFPSYSRAVAIAGTFDWAATPEPIKQATAWLVMNWTRSRQTPPRTQSMNSGRVQFQINQDATETGIEEVDRVVRQYRRASSGLIPV